MANIPRKIGPFVQDEGKTTMEYGYYFKAELDVPFCNTKRVVRVWLPSDYDFSDINKRFPVIYFSDGQNLVNKYLTKYGDWALDKVWHKLYTENNISFIAVGVDCPSEEKDRSNELCPPFLPTFDKDIDNPVGDVFVNYIADTLRPLINELFYTLVDKENTAIGGSSMGGIMAFYGGATRSDVFGFSLDFSPAFLLYKQKKWREILGGLNIRKENGTKFFFYVGGIDFEHYFVSKTVETYKYLKKLGFDKKQVALIYDSRMNHHENSWNKYLGDAISFWLKNN